MSTLQPLCLLLGIDSKQLSKQEFLLTESNIFINICEELKKLISEKNKEYFNLIKNNIVKENDMIDMNFIRNIITDILSTEDYSLTGIAAYTDTPEEVIYDLVSGRNTNPSFLLTRKIIDLHMTAKPSLYTEIINKIKQKILIAA